MMPSLYIDSGFQDVVRDEQDRLARKRAAERGCEPHEVHIAEREALLSLLPEDVVDDIEEART